MVDQEKNYKKVEKRARPSACLEIDFSTEPSLLISITLYSFNFFIQKLYPLRVLPNVVVRIFAIIIIGISTIALIIAIAVVENPNNYCSKYPQYDIKQYSQWV